MGRTTAAAGIDGFREIEVVELVGKSYKGTEVTVVDALRKHQPRELEVNWDIGSSESPGSADGSESDEIGEEEEFSCDCL